MRVLLLRAKDRCFHSANLLMARGHEPIVAPLLNIEFLPFAAPSERFDGWIAASAEVFNADLPRHWRAEKFYLVGARTQESAQRAGFHQIVHVAERAGALADWLAGRPGRKFCLLAARDRKRILETRLPQAGHAVQTLEIYEAVAAKHFPETVARLMAQGQINAVLHYSRRSAQIFIRLARQNNLEGAARALRHAALSPDVAAPLLAMDWAVGVAQKPNEAALIEALENFAPL